MNRIDRLCRSFIVCALAVATTGPVFGQGTSAPAPGTLTVRVVERTVILPRSKLATLTRRTVDIGEGGPLDDVEGPWRAIIPDDLRHARWIRGLVTISVESLK